MDIYPSEIRRTMQNWSGVAAVGYLILALSLFGLRGTHPHPQSVETDNCTMTENGQEVPCPDYVRSQLGLAPKKPDNDGGAGLCYLGMVVGLFILIPASIAASSARSQLRNLEFQMLDQAYSDQKAGRPTSPLPIDGTCPYCGTPQLVDQDYCGKCGRRLND